MHSEGQTAVFTAFSLRSNRAVYFACYSKAKEQFNGIFVPNSNTVHIFSAGSAGALARGRGGGSRAPPRVQPVPGGLFQGLGMSSVRPLHLGSFF